MPYLNIFAYQTFGLQQFGGSFLNSEVEPREISTSKKYILETYKEKIVVDK